MCNYSRSACFFRVIFWDPNKSFYQWCKCNTRRAYTLEKHDKSVETCVDGHDIKSKVIIILVISRVRLKKSLQCLNTTDFYDGETKSRRYLCIYCDVEFITYIILKMCKGTICYINILECFLKVTARSHLYFYNEKRIW